jgi:predicted AAA+ superfamily ATPase
MPICALLGARQVGKTTLAKSLEQQYSEVNHFDLEDPSDLVMLDSPKLALQNLKGLVVIDEIQRKPDLFPYLRVLVDTNPEVKLLILGSASRELIRQSSETLAGRINYIYISPFYIKEVENTDLLWRRGGYPKSYLTHLEEESQLWRKAYITTFLERDLKMLGFDLSPQTIRRLWAMIAHYHGNIMNYSELSRSLSVSDKTIKNYIDIWDGTFMVRTLKPWYSNISKRQIKSPKSILEIVGYYIVYLE